MKLFKLLCGLVVIAFIISTFFTGSSRQLDKQLTQVLGNTYYICFGVIKSVLVLLLLGGQFVFKGNWHSSKASYMLAILLVFSVPVMNLGYRQLDQFLSNSGLEIALIWAVFLIVCLTGLVIDSWYSYIKYIKTKRAGAVVEENKDEGNGE